MSDNYYNEVIKITTVDETQSGIKVLENLQSKIQETKALAGELSNSVIAATKETIDAELEMARDFDQVIRAVIKQRNNDEIAASIQQHQDLAAIRKAAQDAQLSDARDMDQTIRAFMKADEEVQKAFAEAEIAVEKAKYKDMDMIIRAHFQNEERMAIEHMKNQKFILHPDAVTPFSGGQGAGFIPRKPGGGGGAPQEEESGGPTLGQGLRTGAGMLGMAGSFRGAAGLYTLERIAQMAGVADTSIASLTAGTVALGGALAAVTVPAAIMYLGHDFAHELAEMSVTIRGAETDLLSVDNILNNIAAGSAKVSAEYNVSTTEVVKAAKMALQSGIESGDVNEFTEKAAMLSRAVRILPTDAANMLTALRDAFNGSMKDMDSYADTLTNIHNLGRVNMDGFADSLGRVMPLAQQAGISFEELGSAITTLTRRDFTEDQAVTSMANILKSLTAPSAGAKAEMHSLGIEFDKTGIAGKKFSDIIQEIVTKTNGNTGDILKMIPDIRGERGIAGLIESLPLLRQLEEQFKQTGTAAANASRVMDTTGEKLESKWYEATNTIKLAGVELLKFVNGEKNFAQDLEAANSTFDGQMMRGIVSTIEAGAETVESAFKFVFGSQSFGDWLRETGERYGEIFTGAFADKLKGDAMWNKAIADSNAALKKIFQPTDDMAAKALKEGHDGGLDDDAKKREEKYKQYQSGETDRRLSPKEKDEIKSLQQEAMEIQHTIDDAAASMKRVREERVKDIQAEIALERTKLHNFEKGDGAGDTASAIAAQAKINALVQEQHAILSSTKTEQEQIVEFQQQQASKLGLIKMDEQAIRDIAATRTQTWQQIVEATKREAEQLEELDKKRRAAHELEQKEREAAAAATKQYEHEVFDETVRLLNANAEEHKKFLEKKVEDTKKIEEEIRKEHEKTADMSLRLEERILQAKEQQLKRTGGANAVFRNDRQSIDSTISGAKDKINDGTMTESELHSTVQKLEKLIEDMAKNDPNKSREVKDLMEGKMQIDDLTRAFTEAFDKQENDKLGSVNARSFKKLSPQDAIDQAKKDVATKQEISNTVNINVGSDTTNSQLAEMIAQKVQAAIDTAVHRGASVSPIPVDSRNTSGGTSYVGSDSSNDDSSNDPGYSETDS
jgi:TP901 family phage tail tape measure protein